MGEHELDAVIAAVETGNSRMSLGYEYAGVLPDDLCFKSSDAFDGDLNAAKALHEALLPERAVANLRFARRYDEESYATIEMPGGHKPLGRALNPARAWLIAILHAYRGMQG